MSEESFDLVIRGRRVLTTAGIAAREVGVRGGKIVAIEPLGNGLAGRRGHRTRRRRNPDPRPGGHPRPRQRARPHRVGGLRLRHPRRGGRRRDHHHRHAAELHPAHHQRGRPQAQARGGRGPGVRGRRVLGRRRPGQQGRPPPAARRGRLRLQVLPAALRRGRVPAPGGGRDGGGHGRAEVLRLAHDRPRRGLPRHRPRTPPRRRPLLHVPGLPPPRRREQGHRRGDRAGPLDRRPRPHPAPVLLGRAAHDRHRQSATASTSPWRPARTTSR